MRLMQMQLTMRAECRYWKTRIADAKHAATTARKAVEVICGNAGYAMAQRDLRLPNKASEQFKQCTDAMQASNDASGLRSRLTGELMPSEYACSGKPGSGRRI